MKRALVCAVGFGVACAIASELAPFAGAMRADTAVLLLMGLAAFLTFEWTNHYFGAKIWLWPRARADRAAWASLSSTAIWIAVLALAPVATGALRLDAGEPSGIALMAGIALAALAAKLWFLKGIYGVRLARAARLWLVTRGTALALAGAALGVYTLSGAVRGYVAGMVDGVRTCMLRM